MKYFSIRTNIQPTIKSIFDGEKRISFSTLSWYKDEIKPGDIVFVVVSGDEAKKDFEYSNGLKAIARIVSDPMDEPDGKHFGVNAEIISNLQTVITKNDLYKYPSLKNAPNVGPETIKPPNQALRMIDEKQGKDIIRALFKLLDPLKIENAGILLNIINNDVELEELLIKNEEDKSDTNNGIIQEEFVKWFRKPENYKKSYEGLVTVPVLDFWNSTYFNNLLFAVDFNDVEKSILGIEKLIGDKGNTGWRSLSESTSNGAPEAVLGKNNYLKFLSEFVKDEKNLKELKDRTKSVTVFQTVFNYLKFCENLKSANLRYDDHFVLRFVSSLLTKPFVILTGLSGSGKTKLAQAFASWICESEKQYCLVPVGADWTNREPLLGFPNALKSGEYVMPDNGVLDLLIAANANKDKPYFLILDEMNLSHVERYFADFLSSMESSKAIPLHSDQDWKDGTPAKAELPENLFVIGTVNIDETTYMFSPKVLDRASVIEFRVTKGEMEGYLQSNTQPSLQNLISAGADMAADFVKMAKNTDIKAKEPEMINKILLEFFTELKKTGAEFGYRSAGEILRFAAVMNKITPDRPLADIIDSAIMQKLLPKVHGSRKKLEGVLLMLANLCIQDSVKKERDFKVESLLITDDPDSISSKFLYPLSFEKISRMYKGLHANGFTSYAEA